MSERPDSPLRTLHVRCCSKACNQHWHAEAWYPWADTYERREHFLACISAAMIEGHHLLYGNPEDFAVRIEIKQTTFYGETAAQMRKKVEQCVRWGCEAWIWLRLDQEGREQNCG